MDAVAAPMVRRRSVAGGTAGAQPAGVDRQQGAGSDSAGGSFVLRGVSKRFDRGDQDGDGAAISIDALDIPLGGIIAIVGGSGSGKTTLLNLLGGLERPQLSEGTGRFELRLGDGQPPHRLDGRDYPRQRVSYVFQQGYLLSQASIALNLSITRRAAGHAAPARSLVELLGAARLDTAADATQIGSSGRRKTLQDRAVTLSGGQQQRLNIARALGRDPALLFADELSSSLDPQTAVEVLEALRRWVRGDAVSSDASDGSLDPGPIEERPADPDRQGDTARIDRTRLSRTMLWVTHDYALACRFADAMIVLAPGRTMPGLTHPIELADRPERLTPAHVESWLRQGAVPADWLVSEVKPLPEPRQRADAPVTRTGPTPSPFTRLALSLANMGEGVRLSWMEAFREPRRRRGNALLHKLAAPFRFAHWVRALQLAAVLALVLIVSFGQNSVVDYFDRALDDPSLRHVIVQQNVRHLRRSVIDDASLISLSEEIDATDGVPPGDRRATRWGFGRFTESVDVYPRGRDDIAPGFVAELTIGVLERTEPVYSGLDIVPLGEGLPGCRTPARASAQELIPYADELALVVSADYIDDAVRMFDIDLCAEPYVDLWDAGRPLTFRIVGVAARLPADGYDRFDAIMQADVWRNWTSRVGKPARPGFSRAAVYFDQRNHGTVIDALRERAFAFDEEIVSKFERLIGTAATLRNTFLAMTWLSLVVALMVAAGLIWSYLKQNAKAIALLRAHGAWVAPLVSAIPFQLLLTYAYSVAILATAVGAWNLAAGWQPISAWVARISDGAMSIEPVRRSTLLQAGEPLAVTLLVMVVVGLASLAFWSATHPNLAHELRDTE